MNKIRKRIKIGIRQKIASFSIISLLLNVAMVGVLFAPSANTLKAEEIISNPALSTSCGIDMVLVIDSSSSMYGDPLQQEKDAFNGFVNAFLPNTPTRVAVVNFNTTAELLQEYSSDVTTLETAINSVTTTPDAYREDIKFTNWQDALIKSYNGFTDKPDLIIFASDGNPNRYGNPAITAESTIALSYAINQANAIKSGGTRIVALGIGDSVDSENLKQISGPIVAPPADIGENADVILADFATLASSLSDLADELCGGTVTVKKFVDGSPTDGWEFTSASIGNSVTPLSDTTTNGGFVMFDVENLPSETSYVSVTETLQSGYILESALCDDGDNGQLSDLTISGIEVQGNDAVYCEFYNISVSTPICGNGVIETPETCDDGNTVSNDGCSDICLIETINAGDIVINEIIQNPNAVGDSVGEWFELYNKTTKDINIEGCVIDDNDSNSHIVDTVSDSLVVPAIGYIVLARNGDSSLNGGLTPDYVYSGIDLANADDEIIFSCQGTEIDRVEYDGGPIFPNPTGKSMILADVLLDNNDGDNWCESTSVFGVGDLGTPGAVNDSCIPCTDTDDDGVCDIDDNCVTNPNPNQEDADDDGVGDACDNCVNVENPDQADADLNGVGDVCETGEPTLGSISGCKYKDVADIGLRNEGEIKLSGWKIQLIRCPYPVSEPFLPKSNIDSDPQPGVTGACTIEEIIETDEEGCYSFTGLSAGGYGVSEVSQPTWTQTFPLNETFYFFNLESTDNVVENEIDVYFLNRQHPQCSDGIDNDNDEYIDINDPTCHSDGDYTNEDSYTPEKDNEQNTPPVITLLPESMTIYVGTSFNSTDYATADDNEDGDITIDIVSTGSVDTGTVNTYYVEYNVVDSEGMPALPKTLTVNVISQGGGCTSNCGGSTVITVPAIIITNEKVVYLGEGEAEVTWTTNIETTEQISYGDNSLPTNSDLGALPEYGYDSVNEESSFMTKEHSVIISGLTDGIPYFFRPIADRIGSTGEKIGIEVFYEPGEVKGVEAPEEPCTYLLEYVKLGAENNPIEVMKVETFLNVFEGEKLAVNGIYELVDFQAVERFQAKYIDLVLAPWSHNSSTGYVYITTKKRINEIYCQIDFPLTEEQASEVALYASRFGVIPIARGEGTIESGTGDEGAIPGGTTEGETTEDGTTEGSTTEGETTENGETEEGEVRGVEDEQEMNAPDEGGEQNANGETLLVSDDGEDETIVQSSNEFNPWTWLIILIVLGAIAYYFLFFAPKNKKDDIDLLNN
ncbi:MAG: lamin tail domain-containing protein [Candidatus Pacebacteria bacterium]|nr:lamin tail domain-containing protein [Candidatus Paceibacterota bacterium]